MAKRRYIEILNQPSGSIIVEKDHVKDLGVTLSNMGNFSEHIHKVVTKVMDPSFILMQVS